MPGRPAEEPDGFTPPELRVVGRKADHNFDELVRRTYQASLAHATRLVGNLEDASDVIQEAYLKAYRALEHFRGDAAFETWFYRIVSNTAATFRARRQKTSTEEFTEEILSQNSLRSGELDDDGDTNTSNRIDLERALAKLPSRMKAVVVLKDLYGLSHREVAEKLSITEAAAKVWLHRGRKRLVEIVFSNEDEHAQGDDDAA